MSEHHDAPKAHEPHAIHEEPTKGPHDPKIINPKMSSDIATGLKNSESLVINSTRPFAVTELM